MVKFELTKGKEREGVFKGFYEKNYLRQKFL
jgi:hypothetical protein